MNNPKWSSVNATIDSADRFNITRNTPSGWHVIYSYRVDGNDYSGDCRDYSSNSPRSYNKGDSLPIEYLIARPQKSRIPGSRTYLAWARLPYAIAIGAFL